MDWQLVERRKCGRFTKNLKEEINREMSTRELKEEQWNDRKEWKLEREYSAAFLKQYKY